MHCANCAFTGPAQAVRKVRFWLDQHLMLTWVWLQHQQPLPDNVIDCRARGPGHAGVVRNLKGYVVNQSLLIKLELIPIPL